MLIPNAAHSDALGLTSRQTRTAVGPCPITLTSSLDDQTFSLSQGACVVGSDAGADYVLRDKTVSRRHLSLELVPEGVRVRDLGSTNGSHHDGRLVSDLVLTTNGEVRLGRASIHVRFTLDAGVDPQPRASYGVLRANSDGM